MSQKELIPFTVIGGFLGAGKTSLVNRILHSDKSRRHAVLVNDFGLLDIDYSLITSFDGKLLKFSNGCICCSLAGGMVDAMLDLMQQSASFDDILVEASGVSNPSRIMDFARLDTDLRPGLTLVLADAINLPHHFADTLLTDTIATQFSSADMVLLTKADIATEEQIAKSRAIIAQQQPDASLITLDTASFPIELILGHYRDERAVDIACHTASDEHHTSGFTSLSFKGGVFSEVSTFLSTARNLTRLIIRGKGYIVCRDATYLWQQVGRQIECQKHDIQPKSEYSEIVIIGNSDLSLVSSELTSLGFECLQSGVKSALSS